MPVKKTVLNIITGGVILGVLIFACLQAAKHPELEKIRTAFKDKIRIGYNNLRDSMVTSRRRPLSTMELEEYLKSNLAVPFANFSQDDWEWFWQLLYAKVTDDSSGWPKRKVQRTRQEIQDILTDYYYQPFGFFKEEQWRIFWQDILKGRVFKYRER